MIIANKRYKNILKNCSYILEDENRLESNNKSWICNKLFTEEDKKVRDHNHITQKNRDSAHSNSDINLKLTTKCSCNVSWFERLWWSVNYSRN